MQLPERRRAVRPPGPDLRRAVPQHPDAGVPELRSEARVELAVVHQQRGARPPRLGGARRPPRPRRAGRPARACRPLRRPSPWTLAGRPRGSFRGSRAPGHRARRCRRPAAERPPAAAARSPDASPATTSNDVTQAPLQRTHRLHDRLAVLPEAERAEARYAGEVLDALDVGFDRVLQAVPGQDDLLVDAATLRLRAPPGDEPHLALATEPGLGDGEADRFEVVPLVFQDRGRPKSAEQGASSAA